MMMAKAASLKLSRRRVSGRPDTVFFSVACAAFTFGRASGDDGRAFWASALHTLRVLHQKAFEQRPMKGLLSSSAGMVNSFRVVILRPFRGKPVWPGVAHGTGMVVAELNHLLNHRRGILGQDTLASAARKRVEGSQRASQL